MYFNISHENLSVKLCGKEVLLVSHETYLGNFIGSDILDRAITQSLCAFNQSSNHLIADFSMIDSFSLHKLHSNYCMSLYGCELWNYNSRYVNDIYAVLELGGFASQFATHFCRVANQFSKWFAVCESFYEGMDCISILLLLMPATRNKPVCN